MWRQTPFVWVQKPGFELGEPGADAAGPGMGEQASQKPQSHPEGEEGSS